MNGIYYLIDSSPAKGSGAIGADLPFASSIS
jgi:hypothetical protein